MPASRASWSRSLPPPAAPWSATPAPFACTRTCRWSFPKSTPTISRCSSGRCWRKQSGGYIVTNPNCSAIGLVVALAPLHRKFGIESIFVTTMQAVSGAGYPGVASLDILGNVIPYIAKEEEKMEEETRKLLGRLNGDQRRARRLQHDRALQSRCGGRRPHRVGFGKAEAEGRRRRNHRGVQRLSLDAAGAGAAARRRRSRLSTTMRPTVRSRASMWTAATA